MRRLFWYALQHCYGQSCNELQRHLDLASIFDEQTLEEATVLCLLDAVSNVDIAHHFSSDENLLRMLQGVQNSPRADKHTQSAVRKLLSRLRGWQSFEDALSNTRGNFAQCASMLRDIGTDDQSLGIWLECMMIHEDLVTKLGENPVLPNSQSHPPFLFRNPMPAVSHDEFIVFVRVFIGISSVLAVWAWADSIGHDLCRERTLAVLNLWQGVDGYREVCAWVTLFSIYELSLWFLDLESSSASTPADSSFGMDYNG